MLSSTILPQHENAIAAAIRWVEGALLGSIATSIATIAIALFAFAMFQGRFDLRIAGRAALGAFILFGAPMIAVGLLGALGGREAAALDLVQQEPVASAVSQMPKNPPIQDPYAGAAVPQLQP